MFSDTDPLNGTTTIINYDTMDIAYVGSNVLENQIFYIIKVNTSVSFLYIAYTLTHEFIGDCSNFKVNNIEYNGILTSNIYNKDSSELLTYITNTTNTNSVSYIQFNLTPSLNSYILSNRDYVRNNCFTTFNNTKFLEKINENFNNYIRLPYSSETDPDGQMVEFNYSVSYYNIDYDNFVYNIVVAPNYRRFYYYEKYSILN